jgi:hypothetical protein
MNVLFFSIGLVLIIIVLGDAFETMVLPRRVTRRVRLARIFFRYTWRFWLAVAGLIPLHKRRETFIGFFGPFSVIMLIILWATGLVFGFALLHWASGSAITVREGTAGFSTYLYLSGTTLFTLGLGDVIPGAPFGRGLIAFEAGLGLGFLALVISYLPLLNQSFASREVTISLFDSHAGSPPTTAEMIRRHVNQNEIDQLREHLYEWERWSSELLESHLSYPVLALFRSQHDNQSWLGSLTVILDTCSFVLAGLEGVCKHQAKFTFAMARHTIVDLAQIFNCPPLHPDKDRLPSTELEHLCSVLASTGLKLQEKNVLEQELSELRRMYEPYVHSLSRHMHITIPPWILKSEHADNWQTTPWDITSSLQKKKRIQRERDEHF